MNFNADARNRIELAIKRLGHEYPLHAGILASWGIEESSAVSTMGVGFRGNRLCLVYAPEFIESVGMNELEGVLHHETNHVLFDHVFHEPEANEDANSRTIAEEVTVNEYFVANPDRVLGTLNHGRRSTYGRASMIVDRPAEVQRRPWRCGPMVISTSAPMPEPGAQCSIPA